MTDALDQAISDWLESGHVENSNEVFDAKSCDHVASSLIVHGLLTDVGRHGDQADAVRIARLMAAIDSESVETVDLPKQPSANRRLAFLASAASVAALLVLMFVLSGPQQNVQAAMTALDKMIDAASLPVDRTYEVSVVEEYPQNKRPRNLPEERWRQEPKEQIDGAKLYVRGADKYVFTRLLRDGRQRLTGCDSEQSWAFREDGPVHVSSDLSRFRGGMPGQQQDIPFLNIHLHLSQLKTGYEIELTSEHRQSSDGVRLSSLTATRRSRDVRGPKQIEIWFDEGTGTVHEMTLTGLPRGGGGPKTVSLKLTGQSDLGPDFFSHETHHEPDRRIRYEE